ncbi:hypothetical protein BCR44DRAFT_1427495 [Catenaria anguillulae PL171]|uniref:Glutathione S-transferase n=1 Tax=Catenaria anguillulae PL171 TaxID=765915 RepID=A0A1Y2HXE9_9FUNG|nr:hypothetical protein BCR44DRAFT_1427495 [Catenaria anguillulae PL171]
MILEVAGVPYKNKYPADWAKEKPTTPFGHIPCLLFVDPKTGKELQVAESHAINRYLATKHGLVHDDLETRFVADSLDESIRDLMASLMGSLFMLRGDARKQALAGFKTKDLPAFIDAHSKYLKANGSNGYYFGNKLSYVELSMFCAVVCIRMVLGECELTEKNAPELVKLHDVVAANTKLQAYWASDRFHRKFSEAPVLDDLHKGE